MNIRPTTSEDTVILVGIERSSPTSAHWSEEQYRQAVDWVGDGPRRLVLVAETLADERGSAGREVNTPTLSPQKPQKQGRCAVVGFLVARHVSEEWELENIVVAPEVRNRGIGRQLLDALMARALENKSRAVFLEVRESNAAARKLYQKAGFREGGRRKGYYSDPLEDAVLYSKNLG